MATNDARVDQIISNLRNLGPAGRLDSRGAIYQYCGTVFDLCIGKTSIDMTVEFCKFKTNAERLICLEGLRDSLNDFLHAECRWVAGSPLVEQSAEWQKDAWDHYKGICDQVARTEQQLREIVSDIVSFGR
jgi:hypothetical protein